MSISPARDRVAHGAERALSTRAVAIDAKHTARGNQLG